ncbi:polyglutamylase complex subunit TTLL1-like [Daktulosphaira vitifoliae]|uniref:polyglutamylase complex subunit TTLL1-like n=1 Tax=Daktulosphaira vitifoliae TaxID=58002 RepID=UPI0021A9BD42|nr:polyglutamylase complex subunit TTLL1-like [Daktulosphaira vitifoliae]
MKSVTYCCDVNRPALLSNFEKRGWTHVGPEDKWNLYWASVQTCRMIFSAESNYRFKEDQIINHFSKHYELTRKDLLIRNMRRYKRESLKYEKLSNTGNDFLKSSLDIIPTTYILPADYNLCLEEFRKNPSIWIIKPCGKSQGTGIFLIDKLYKLKKWFNDQKRYFQKSPINNSYIISRYIENPLLICGKKFDLRLYVLVTSFHPLKAYQFNYGFCRFCSVKYNSHIDNIKNLLAHLTNVSIQKHGKEYNSINGGKWSTENLKLYLTSTKGEKNTQALFEKISWIIVQSLKAVRGVMSSDKHSFECYGYDIIVDSDLKPWLIEVNASPSLSYTTTSDRMLKSKLIESILSVILPPSGVPNSKWDKNPSPDALSNFSVLIKENHVK